MKLFSGRQDKVRPEKDIWWLSIALKLKNVIKTGFSFALDTNRSQTVISTVKNGKRSRMSGRLTFAAFRQLGTSFCGLRKQLLEIMKRHGSVSIATIAFSGTDIDRNRCVLIGVGKYLQTFR